MHLRWDVAVSQIPLKIQAEMLIILHIPGAASIYTRGLKSQYATNNTENMCHYELKSATRLQQNNINNSWQNHTDW